MPETKSSKELLYENLREAGRLAREIQEAFASNALDTARSKNKELGKTLVKARRLLRTFNQEQKALKTKPPSGAVKSTPKPKVSPKKKP